jgi:hypothetical protein
VRFNMSRVWLILLACLMGASAVSAAVRRLPPPAPIYLNLEPIEPSELPPQIDAVIFENRSLFNVQNSAFLFVNPTLFLFTGLGGELYQGQSVLFWTNSGTMVGVPGFRFETLVDARRLPPRLRRKPGARLPKPSAAFINSGDITVSGHLFIHSTNIVSSGHLEGDLGARITVYATNGLADLSRGALREGRTASPFAPAPFFFFNADPELTILYGGTGTNGVYNQTNGTPLLLPSAFPFFTSSNLFTNVFSSQPLPPSHQVLVNPTQSGRPVTFRITNTLSFVPACAGDYAAFAEVRNLGFGFGKSVSVAFVQTNSFIETNITIDVRFLNSFFGATPTIAVQYQSTEFDIIEQQVGTNVITFVDTGSIVPMPPPTNVFQFFPSPSNYQIVRGRYPGFDFGSPGNTLFSPTLFYDTNFSNPTNTYAYSAASYQIGPTNFTLFSTPVVTPVLTGFSVGVHPAAADPTNYPSRIEITAKDLNLDHTRIRAEQVIDIRAANLISNALATVDAPFVSFDVGTTNEENLVIANLAPAVVNRAHGQLSAFSATWTAMVTNTLTMLEEPVNFHVLIVGNCLQFSQPTILHRLAIQATNLVIQDNLFVNNGIRLNAESLTIGTNASLQLPVRASLAFTNLLNVSHLTNYGVLNVPGAGAFFGVAPSGYIFENPKKKRRKRNQPIVPVLERYNDFVNHGIISAASIFVDADYVENSGTVFSPAVLFATNGPLVLKGLTANLSNGVMIASENVEIRGQDVSLRNSVVSAGSTNIVNGRVITLPGAFIIDATNSLGDTGAVFTNRITTSAGMRILRRPEIVGDFFGSSIVVQGGVFSKSSIVWAGEDRGPTVEGFANNLVVGRLTLDGTVGNLFHFSGAAVSNAIYIDYLELLNAATNYNFALGVDPDFTIYIADANVPPDKLTNNTAGRVQWVSEFIGPQSSTNLTYPDGSVHTFNAGLVRSKDLDSDGDGIVNADDCTPIPVPGLNTAGAQCPSPSPVALATAKSLSTDSIALTIALVSGGQEVVLNWNATANSGNTVEFADSLAGGAWQPLTNFINGPVDARVTVKDAVGAPLRVYRVRMDAGKP